MFFYNFYSHYLFFFVIYTFKCCTKRSFSYEFNYFISVRYVVSNDYLEIAFFIIISMIAIKKLFSRFFSVFSLTTIYATLRIWILLIIDLISLFTQISILFPIHFLRFVYTKKKDLLVIKNFSLFILCKLLNIIFKNILWICRQWRYFFPWSFRI